MERPRNVVAKAGPYRGLVGYVTETLPDGRLVVSYPRGTYTAEGASVSTATFEPRNVEDGPKDRLLRPLHRCDKGGCGRYATTVEIGSEHFPSALCEDHAERPDQYGTFDRPFRIPQDPCACGNGYGNGDDVRCGACRRAGR